MELSPSAFFLVRFLVLQSIDLPQHEVHLVELFLIFCIHPYNNFNIQNISLYNHISFIFVVLNNAKETLRSPVSNMEGCRRQVRSTEGYRARNTATPRDQLAGTWGNGLKNLTLFLTIIQIHSCNIRIRVFQRQQHVLTVICYIF